MNLAETSSLFMPSRGGFTLLELSIALAIGITLLAVLGNVLISSTNSLDYIMQDTVVLGDIKDVVNGLREELRSSTTGLITIDTSNADYDVLTFKVSSGGTSPSYGAVDINGNFQNGWSIRYTVSSSNLVRNVLDGGGTVQSSSIVVEDVDTRFSGQKGFWVTKTGSLYNVNIRINKTFRDSNSARKGMGSTVFVPN